LVGVFDNVVSHALEYELLEPLCVIPPDDGAVNPTDFNPDANACASTISNATNASTAAIPNPSASTAAIPNASASTIVIPNTNASTAVIPNANALTAAIPNANALTIASPNANASSTAIPNAQDSTDANPCTAEESNVEPDREPDIFDNEEEYVGVDDEHIYISVPPTHPANTNSAQASVDNAGPVVADGGAPLETEIDDIDPKEITVLHDPKNPKIVKGQLFSDIVTFRKAIRHYTVKKGFELAKLQTDPTRFIAHCAAEGCPWRIHASRIFDNKTIHVGVVLLLLFVTYSVIHMIFILISYVD